MGNRTGLRSQARVLDDDEVRERCEGLFGFALAEALLAALAREPYVREHVAKVVA